MKLPRRRSRTLIEEFRLSYRAGPRVWRYTGILLALLLFGSSVFWLAVPLVIAGLVLGVLFVLPALIGRTLGRSIARIRDARVLRQLQRPLR